MVSTAKENHMSDFENRQAWDLGAWPEMFEKAKELLAMIFSGPPDIQTNRARQGWCRTRQDSSFMDV
jgi:hypothetical protein